MQAVLVQPELAEELDDVLLARGVRQAPQLDDCELAAPVQDGALHHGRGAPHWRRGPVSLRVDPPLGCALPNPHVPFPPKTVVSQGGSKRGRPARTGDEASAGGRDVLDWWGVDGTPLLDILCDGLVVVRLFGGEDLDVTAAHVLPVLLEGEVDLWWSIV